MAQRVTEHLSEIPFQTQTSAFITAGQFGWLSPVPGVPLGGSVLGLVSLAMPAMTAVVVGAVGREHAGVASGVLNAARQSGGTLGVALLGSLLGSGHTLNLHLPLAFAAGGYLVALALAWLGIRNNGLALRGGRAGYAHARPLRRDGRGTGWLVRRCRTVTRLRSVSTG